MVRGAMVPERGHGAREAMARDGEIGWGQEVGQWSAASAGVAPPPPRFGVQGGEGSRFGSRRLGRRPERLATGLHATPSERAEAPSWQPARAASLRGGQAGARAAVRAATLEPAAALELGHGGALLAAAQEERLELVHACVDEEQGRVVVRHDGRRGPARVRRLLLEEVDEGLADLGHRGELRAHRLRSAVSGRSAVGCVGWQRLDGSCIRPRSHSLAGAAQG